MNLIELTPTQARQWDDVVSLLGYQALSFRQLLYRMLNAQNNTSDKRYIALFTEDIPVAATDAINVLINPVTFFSKEYTLLNRVYILGHEIGHCILNDVFYLHKCTTLGKVPMTDGTFLPFDNPTMQWAMDARLNPWLDSSRIGVRPKDGVYDPRVQGTDAVADVYKRRFKEKPPGQGGQPGGQPRPGNGQPQQGQGQGQGKVEGFDLMLPPGKATGKNPNTTAAEHSPQKWAAEIAIACELEKIKNQGKLPAAFERLFKPILEPKIPWTEHIRTLINRCCSGDDYDWTRQHPWYGDEHPDQFFYPCDTGKGAGWVVIWDDTSGSRNAKELGEVRAETAGILEQVSPRRLTYIGCDAKIQQVVELDDPAQLRDIKQVGGGGTDYSPVLDWIAKQREIPDLFIGFTDGYVDHPKRVPGFPVIWASSTDKEYPFGDVVRLKD